MMRESRGLTRRGFLWGLGVAPFVPSFLDAYKLLANPAEKRVKIANVQAMVMQGPRTYTFVKVSSDSGLHGIAEAYGSPGIGVKEQILALKPALVGKDPLQIDTIFTGLGNRTDGSAHQMMRAVSGVEMALWDLAGKILEVPAWKLLGCKFRDRVRVYDHAGPRNMLDKGSCAEWAAAVREQHSGFTCHKFGIQADPRTAGSGAGRGGRGGRAGGLPGEEGGFNASAPRTLTPAQIVNVQKGFENVRDAIGWQRDFMVHGMWSWDVRTAVDLSEALAGVKPLWLEDPLPVEYTDSWKRLTEMSKVPICTGENLARREGFLDFILHQGADILEQRAIGHRAVLPGEPRKPRGEHDQHRGRRAKRLPGIAEQRPDGPRAAGNLLQAVPQGVVMVESGGEAPAAADREVELEWITRSAARIGTPRGLVPQAQPRAPPAPHPRRPEEEFPQLGEGQRSRGAGADRAAALECAG